MLVSNFINSRAYNYKVVKNGTFSDDIYYINDAYYEELTTNYTQTDFPAINNTAINVNNVIENKESNFQETSIDSYSNLLTYDPIEKGQIYKNNFFNRAYFE